jgi:hypothetical protein
MTCGAWRTDRPRGYNHRKTRPGVHQRERRPGKHKNMCPSAPDPPIYPMAQIHRRVCLQVHLSSTPGSSPTGKQPDEQHWNQIIARLRLSIAAYRLLTEYRNRKPYLAVWPPRARGLRDRHTHALLYSNVSERCRSRVRYAPDSGLSSSTGPMRTTPHIPVPPRHNWRTMHC